jgi:hypothetical protein
MKQQIHKTPTRASQRIDQPTKSPSDSLQPQAKLHCSSLAGMRLHQNIFCSHFLLKKLNAYLDRTLELQP